MGLRSAPLTLALVGLHRATRTTMHLSVEYVRGSRVQRDEWFCGQLRLPMRLWDRIGHHEPYVHRFVETVRGSIVQRREWFCG